MQESSQDTKEVSLKLYFTQVMIVLTIAIALLLACKCTMEVFNADANSIPKAKQQYEVSIDLNKPASYPDLS